jgi:hypothetical protein
MADNGRSLMGAAVVTTLMSDKLVVLLLAALIYDRGPSRT